MEERVYQSSGGAAVAKYQPHRRGAGRRRAPEDSGKRGHLRPQARAGADDLIARLERLEATVAAIASRLGVGAERGPARRNAKRQATPDAAHAVVRTVARGLSGRVKQYNASRGFGFAVSPDAPGDVFFHRSDCSVDPATLATGAEVVFDLVEMANGQVKAIGMAPFPGGLSRGRPERSAGAASPAQRSRAGAP